MGEDTPRPRSPLEPSKSVDVHMEGDMQLTHAKVVLPWKPKIRPSDFKLFLNMERKKFFGYTLDDDVTTIAGLPRPIVESLQALRKHQYVSLADIQAEKDEDYNKYYFSQKEAPITETPSEILYKHLQPRMAQHIIALLKVLLAAAPSSKAKTESINILADVLPPQCQVPLSHSSNAVDDLAALGQSTASVCGEAHPLRIVMDVNRHKEVLVKSISGIILLLLKHLKLNHIYQMEFVSQHLVFANCIPLILKFFDQNVVSYIGSRNELYDWNYPYCVYVYACRVKTGEAVNPERWWPDFRTDVIDKRPQDSVWGQLRVVEGKGRGFGDHHFLWRNMFSCITLLRVLNKLTKWKHQRTMMMVVFKSAPILKRVLRVKEILLQFYTLKLLKMQAKYLGRQWRKSNMEIISAIYNKVRHRLTDDWAYGNETQSKPWDFQSEEASLRSAIEKFNVRRYGSECMSSSAPSVEGGLIDNRDKDMDDEDVQPFQDPEYIPYDNNIVSVLGVQYEITDRFKRNYEKWLEREVYTENVDWERLLAMNRSHL